MEVCSHHLMLLLETRAPGSMAAGEHHLGKMEVGSNKQTEGEEESKSEFAELTYR